MTLRQPNEARLHTWWEVAGVAVLVTLATGLLWWVQGELGLVWDEPPGIQRQHAVWNWMGDLVGSSEARARALSRRGMAQGWPFAREAPDEHGPVYALLSLVTWKTTAWLLGELRAHRLATLLLFAVTAGVVFRLCRVRWGVVAAVAALAALLFNPRLFAHAQLATTDVIMACFWFFAAVAFLRACETGRRPWLFGVFVALAVMSKLTGVLVLPAMAVWALLIRPRGGLRVFAWSLPLVLPVMIAVHPGWWFHPVEGLVRWCRGVADYQQKVPTYYLGEVYDFRISFPPWHNPWVLTATMVPVGLLVLGLAGALKLAGELADWRVGKKGVRRDDLARLERNISDGAFALWALVNFGVLMGLRMLPSVPGHDGLRQLVAAFLFFAVLVGYGAWAVGSLSKRLSPKRHASYLSRGFVAVCIGTAAWSTVRIHPYELAYYNALLGGPPGAKAAGMETTYYWDAFGDEAIAWMNAHLPSGATVLIFPPPDVRTFGWLQRWGRLRDDLEFLNLDAPHTHERLLLMQGDQPTYLVFLMRQGLFMPKEPGRTKLWARLAAAPALYELAPERVGVRLLAVFDRETFVAVLEQTPSEDP